MRSIIYIILAFSMINIVLSDTLCALREQSSKKDCTDYKLTDEKKKEEDADSCCYVTYKEDGKEEQECGSGKKKDVNKDYVKELEDYLEVTDLSIECHSNWISFSLLFLLFSLLF